LENIDKQEIYDRKISILEHSYMDYCIEHLFLHWYTRYRYVYFVRLQNIQSILLLFSNKKPAQYGGIRVLYFHAAHTALYSHQFNCFVPYL